MSVYINHLRRSLSSSADCKRICMATATFAPLRISPSDASVTNLPLRHFAATAAAKKSKSGSSKDDQNGLSYRARKEAAKQKRRDAWNRHQDRLERLKTRRDNSPKDVKKEIFRSWWDKEMKYHDVLRRTAKKEGKPWRIRVAATVERLPVVTPDMEPWERDYIDLRDYLWTYGREYPEECGFMFAPDKPEDHIVPTDEELLANLPFTPAPRETEADATGDVRTRDRQLKTRAYLALRTDAEGNRSGPRWTFPSAVLQQDDTMLETAQRAVSDAVGTDLVLWCPSNAPMTVNFRVYNKNLPEAFRENYYGEKIFYYRVQYDHGDVDEGAVKAGEDYAWLTREEMVERVEGERGKHQAKFFHYML
mmetsp:Transcript_55947/g.118965  ORF Transcript_55947/g.118965 Transcript_55947/m.118965 type:complete len:364 (+) Transcript_55947:82-1173(+)|eukprot:CAMPEP_0172553434 /NCGR_PEP_ID=MMETSP1067-20121228/50894_1 /TAXON_ID=265564 ORGANISM="Thalassiosira punctigera, Strain Tpunct2005C2" /NCGR_SAMPLE_ID=MMETSP1067 /ASSEMBLY_ACC=CAM_ASM_000444 /LENGTH=363 /DNA_ID=CAMNT_0013341625 /DNA_START=31 /DNA_END=1122 /DNA_ORIENTATION=-